MRIKEKFSKKLLVEGNDDQHVIWSLCQKFNVPENFDVIDCEGISSLIDQLPVRLKQSGIQTIAIIIDADTHINNRWNSISDILLGLGFNIPKELPAEGLLIKKGEISFGIWIMPNNKTNGMLEDFISFLIPNNDKLYNVVNNTLDYIEQQNINKYQLAHRSKAFIHSWLAWQDDPGTPMGLAITKKYLTTEAKDCENLIKWLIATFK